MSLSHRIWKATLAGLAAVLSGCSGQALLNTLSIPVHYSRTNDQVFDADTGLKLDVYAPDKARDAPVVVFFYGGRWSEGARADYEFIGSALARQGFVAVVPDYRLYPAVKYPAFVQDSAQAVRWARENAARFGGDPARLFVMGHSAGAYNAAMLAVDERWLAAVGGSRRWLAGMVGLAGPYDFMPFTDDDIKDMFGPPEQWPDTQPIQHVDGRNAPLLLLHGEDDQAVWPKNTRNLAAKVQAAGGPVETVLYPRMSHTWIVATASRLLQGRSTVMPQTAEFIRRRSGLPVQPAAQGAP